MCGRLMCCLRYEFDAYKDFKSRAPKQNATVETPDGPAKVVDLDVPREIVSLKIMGEKPVKVPLADFDPPEEGSNRPNRVGEEAWQDATTADPIGFAGESALFGTTTQLTGQDKLADPGSVRRTGRGGQKPSKGGGSNGGRAGGGQKGGGNGGQKGGKQADAQAQSARKPRRRRSTKVGGRALPPEAAEAQKRKKQQAALAEGRAERPAAEAPVGQGGQGGAAAPRSSRASARRRGEEAGAEGMQPSKPRPGQKSSGLRQGQKPQQPRQDKAPRPERSGAERRGRRPTGDGGHRRAVAAATRRALDGAGAPERAAAPSGEWRTYGEHRE
ncbi:MAG: hypothetical protein ACLSVD_12050 [Eggerthellaceae bacterium]